MVALHELVHVLFGQAVGDTSFPRWLTEGAAKYLSHDFTLADRQRLEQAAREATWLPLDALAEDFPHDPEQAHLAYAESYTFVAFLMDHFGAPALARLNAQMRSGKAFPEAVEAAFARELATIQEEWFTYLRQKYQRQAFWGTSETLFFMAMTLLFCIAAVRRWRQRRQDQELYPPEEDAETGGEQPI